MKTYNDILNENVFNQKTMRFTSERIKAFSKVVGKKNTKRIIDKVYELYITGNENKYIRSYKHRNDITVDEQKTFELVMKYFNQSMFLGFANFNQTKQNLERSLRGLI